MDLICVNLRNPPQRLADKSADITESADRLEPSAYELTSSPGIYVALLEENFIAYPKHTGG